MEKEKERNIDKFEKILKGVAKFIVLFATLIMVAGSVFYIGVVISGRTVEVPAFLLAILGWSILIYIKDDLG